MMHAYDSMPALDLDTVYEMAVPRPISVANHMRKSRCGHACHIAIWVAIFAGMTYVILHAFNVIHHTFHSYDEMSNSRHSACVRPVWIEEACKERHTGVSPGMQCQQVCVNCADGLFAQSLADIHNQTVSHASLKAVESHWACNDSSSCYEVVHSVTHFLLRYKPTVMSSVAVAPLLILHVLMARWLWLFTSSILMDLAKTARHSVGVADQMDKSKTKTTRTRVQDGTSQVRVFRGRLAEEMRKRSSLARGQEQLQNESDVEL